MNRWQTSPAAWLLALVPLAGCEQRPAAAPPAKPAAPAKVEKLPGEGDLTVIHLTPEAVTRTGIKLAQVARQSAARYQTYPAEAVIPPQRMTRLIAPVTGTLQLTEGAQAPVAGKWVDSGAALYTLTPMLTPERAVLTPPDAVKLAESKATLEASRIAAESDVQQAQVQVEATKLALQRAEQLLKDKAGSAKAVDEARAAHELALKALQSAEARKQMWMRTTIEAGRLGEVEPIKLAAPQAGVIMTLAAVPGQPVTAGATLIDLADPRVLWIRVRIPVTDQNQLQTRQGAILQNWNTGNPQAARQLTPVDAPPSADLLRSSVDVYYQLDNADLAVRPGQKLAVRLPLQEPESSLVVSAGAIVHDIHGGSWVYKQIGPTDFSRVRVELRYIDKGQAVLAAGPSEGTAVVVEGAAELFGAEFGGFK